MNIYSESKSEDKYLRELVFEAVLKERDRCAKIARDFYKSGDVSYDIAPYALALFIADKIEETVSII